MDLLLLSNGKVAGNTKVMEFALPAITELLTRKNVKNVVVIPYAVIRGSHDDRTAMVAESLSHLDVNVTGLHRAEDPVEAIRQADAIIVSGGNTWVLNKTLHDQGLIGPIQQAVMQRGVAYIGWSAGSVISAPTIRTTNDMCIVSAAITPSLGFVPFQINAHYIDATIEGHMGETRDERIEEFLIVNPHQSVIGIPEGSWLAVSGETMTYESANEKPLHWFRLNQERKIVAPGTDVTELMALDC
ncbi:dipeptidase PepE [Photobacterium aphoticum]|uniref:Alpha-aspartyl dipeptidase n=1 Tax=Photobacterium aphoticum TaxID=754436 RepID=A0A0J1GLR2_9GAMM|nr:dipeptidase PepE [Photobacterium aphoticum]KLV00561.1 alpha-aspartyl dipeptidase [Photobacterium aphoticum]PSU59918.1 dipeptidase PepE [Photobacterium aphoticum]